MKFQYYHQRAFFNIWTNKNGRDIPFLFIHSPLAFKNVKCFGMHMYNWLSLASSLSVWLAYLLFGWGSWSKCIKRDFHLITPHHHRPKEREKEEKVTFMWPTTRYDEAVPFFNGSYILFWLHSENSLKIKIPLPHDFYIFISMSSYMTNKNWRYVCDGIKL